VTKSPDVSLRFTNIHMFTATFVDSPSKFNARIRFVAIICNVISVFLNSILCVYPVARVDFLILRQNCPNQPMLRYIGMFQAPHILDSPSNFETGQTNFVTKISIT
jgi:hypothetical protein